MSKAVQAFLARRTLDSQDLLAQRALRAFAALQKLQVNAHDRGLPDAYYEVQRGIECAVASFALVNSDEKYDFAADVDASIPGRSEAYLDLHARPEKALGLLTQAEGVQRALQGVLTPVCMVSGVSSVAILRGVHCLNALHGRVIANDP